jgi:hypothetical protein
MKSLCLSLILVVLLAACDQLAPATPAPTPALGVATLSSADRLAIYSAVAHYHFDPMNKILEDKRWPVIFVSPNLATSLDMQTDRWDGEPTPPELLPLLQDLSPRVEFAAKRMVIQGDRGNAVRDGGIWLGFGTIELDENAVSVDVESFLNGVNAVVYRYELTHQGSQWIVLKAKLRQIS